MQYADVILPLPLAESYTYSIPTEIADRIGVGFRVIVSFGRKRYYTGIVRRITDQAPKGFEIKEIHSLIDTYPIVNKHQLRLWEWISFYYMSTIGEVYNAAIPSKLKLESDTFVELVSTDINIVSLTKVEQELITLLKEGKQYKISQLEKQLKTKGNLPCVYSLIFKGILDVSEEIIQKYKPKTTKTISINTLISEPEVVIGNATKQLELYHFLLRYFEENDFNEIPKAKVQKKFNCSDSVLKGLIDKKILIATEKDISRIQTKADAVRKPYPLNEYQTNAFESIHQCFETKNVCLLHGITSSGKTEIYIHLIEEQIKKQKQILYLVPEIALTTQLITRLHEVFGDKLGVYHSKINDNERAEIWQKMLSDSPFEIIIGVRSSIFLPFRHLGLIIVDEEHETSFKQQDPAPRYHTRDTAIVLAQMYDAKVLLGSATPSIETYFNAKKGKYGLVTLNKRFEEIELPEITIENTKELRRKKKMKTLLTPLLIEDINNALEKGEQVILFRNRRGFVPMLECKNCGWTPKCKQCDVSLTYHKGKNELKCHYCGKTYRIIKTCEACNEESLVQLGMGTEMLEEETKRLFQNASIDRLDSDTTGAKNAYDAILSRFQEGETDILIGTQMLSKGLDFENVSLVGIISADGLLNHPDFRSHERGFQLMMQSAGRAGRKHRRGKVVIQAGVPELPVYQFVVDNDYDGFFNLQLAERKLFRYPPYSRLISIIFKHPKEYVVDSGATYFAKSLNQSLGEMVLGPNKPLISYVQKYHIREIILKLDIGLSPSVVRDFIRKVESNFRKIDDFKYINLYYDVDWV